MAATKLTIGSLANLPDTSNTLLLAGSAANLSTGEKFVLLSNSGFSFSVEAIDSVGVRWSATAYDTNGAPVWSMVHTNQTEHSLYSLSGWHSFALSVDVENRAIQFLFDLYLTDFAGDVLS